MRYITSNLNLKRLYQANTLRIVLIAVFSSTTAYGIASLLPDFISPIIAAIIALTSIKPTIEDTANETLKQVIGTTLGAILGIFIIDFIGINILSVGLVALLSMGIGFILRLTPQASLTIGATILLVAGPLFQDLELVEQRVLGVILGAFTALFFMIIIAPINPQKDILARLSIQGKETSKLLKEVADAVRAKDIRLETAAIWMDRIKVNLDEIVRLRSQLSVIHRDAKWSILLRKSDVASVRLQADIAKSNASNIKSIIVALIAFLEKQGHMTSKGYSIIGKLLFDISESIKDQSKIASETPANMLSQDRANKIRKRRQQLAEELKKMDDTRAIMLGSTLIHEATKIKDNVTD